CRQIIEGTERARGKQGVASSPQAARSLVKLSHKLFHQGRFANACLSTDQHCSSLAGRGCLPEPSQLLEFWLPFQQIHDISSSQAALYSMISFRNARWASGPHWDRLVTDSTATRAYLERRARYIWQRHSLL